MDDPIQTLLNSWLAALIAVALVAGLIEGIERVLLGRRRGDPVDPAHAGKTLLATVLVVGILAFLTSAGSWLAAGDEFRAGACMIGAMASGAILVIAGGRWRSGQHDREARS